jgi:hypothetical protein
MKSPILKNIFKIAGIGTLGALISFLSTIFLTQSSFSEWKEKIFYPLHSEHSARIERNKNSFESYSSALLRIEANQKIMLRALIER